MSGAAAALANPAPPSTHILPEALPPSDGRAEEWTVPHPPKLDVFEGISDEIATVFDGPARKQSYRKNKSSLRYLLIRADVAKLWYFKDSAKSRCKGIISLEDAVLDENPKQFEHRREVHRCSLLVTQPQTFTQFNLNSTA